ncbi:ATP-binding cassette domain-containing protein [Brevundimonas diminuta]|uniref:ABC-F family ATP-binding cassette domain-containing protein n=1 Tax=Brevundimonas diminuta TaxID=293 RepID=UPI0020977BBE|nr:ABC-F family ATP-binding cassette domain-containing protein [Brevundimonas diminuta]MCO8029755.1 ATP-binding cassette domain-containing protein [Brevundimonas diminuta]
MTLNGVAARTPDGRGLFDNLTLAFGRERTAVVGRNGVGKTTLLRLVAGLAEPAEGSVTRIGSVGWLAQAQTPADDETIADTLGVAEPLAILHRVLAGDGSLDDMAEADWTLEERMQTALAEVGLAVLPLDRRTADLSGGEQTRLRLAGLKLAAPDLLVLDEPTNHLDAEARAMIADVVGDWPGGVVLVSHDRALLRRVDRIVELSSLGARVHGGGWDLFIERRDAERAAAERDLEQAERAIGRVQRETQMAQERQARRDRAGKAARANSSDPKILLDAQAQRAEESGARGQRLAERKRQAAEADLTQARERVERVRQLALSMPSTGLPAGRVVLNLNEAVVTVEDDRRLLGPLCLRLTGPERVAVVGPNGAGKTTLLKLIAGLIEPSSGSVERPVRAALLDQQAAVLKADETLVEGWLRLNPEGTPNAARAALARFLFRNVQADRRVGELSGGERLRAALACVMTGAQPPQLLVLDEPTNHLDIDAVEAVEAALSGYDGALVVVSHDVDFIQNLRVDRTIVLKSGQLQPSTTP